MTGEDLAGQWAERTKRSPAALRYHEILGIFKLAVIVQQIYFRWFRGQTGDERFASFHKRVRSLVEAAYARVEATA
jgi:aminoglycoside phosphotransferase (APT) family kinase protein